MNNITRKDFIKPLPVFSSTYFIIHQLLNLSVTNSNTTYHWKGYNKFYLLFLRYKTFFINLEFTYYLLRKSLNVVENVIKQHGKILIINPEDSKLAYKIPQHYYITNRWVGGTLTNWRYIYRLILKLITVNITKLEKQEKKIKQFTKLKRLHTYIQGIKHMINIPELVVVLNCDSYPYAISEAYRLDLLIIGVISNLTKANKITYPIPGNSDLLRVRIFYINMIRFIVENAIKNNMPK